jgi:hypothetical protein
MAIHFASAPFVYSGETPQQALQAGRKAWHFIGTMGLPDDSGTVTFPYLEIPVGCRAIAIGPSSSLSSVAVLWVPPGINGEVVLTADCRAPLVMDLPVNPNAALTGNSGYLNGLVGNSTRPLTGTLKILPYNRLLGLAIPPTAGEILELLVYFDLTGVTLPKGRPDMSVSSGFSTNLFQASETLLWEAPGYGRKMVAWELDNLHASQTVTSWRFVGVTHYFGASAVAEAEHQISPAVGGAANTIAALGNASYVLNGARYHAYRMYATGSAGFTTGNYQYTLSDF